MQREFFLKKGLNLSLSGTAEKEVRSAKPGGLIAILPPDYTGLTLRLLVKEGEHVKAGDAVLADKATERIKIVAPVSGIIKSIVRGERRKLQRIEIEPESQIDYKTFDTQTNVPDLMLESGLFALFRQRPYDVIASPTDKPKAIFVSTFSKMPLAADFSFVVEGETDIFVKGIEALTKIAPVEVGISKEQFAAGIFSGLTDIPGVGINVFDGPNPSGNVGVQINHISPVNKGEIVWTLSPQAIIYLGRLLTTGKVDFRTKVAVAGSEVENPDYCEAIIGTPLQNIIKLKPADHTQRIISGNPLVGRKAEADDFLGMFTTEICAIPEGDDVHEAFGWILPRLKEFSTNRSYFSWLMPKKKYNPDCRIKGGRRHMIMSAEYERVFPMDIFPSYLIKAIITGDIDRQEALGIYEVAPEDFAVAEFIDSSKLELQRIVREGLDILRKENA